MVVKEEALIELRKDREYEEKIFLNLSDFILFNLESLEDVNLKEKEKIKSHLKILMEDTINHKDLFNMLIDYILKSNKDIY